MSREPDINGKELEQRLVDGKWIGEALAESARAESLRTGHSFWYCIVQLRYLNQEELMRFFAGEGGVPYVKISDYAVQGEILKALEPGFCIDNTIFPLFAVGGILYIAAANPFDASLVDAAGRMSGMNVELLMASAASIRAAQDEYWNLDERMLGAHEFLTASRNRLRGVGFYRKTERVPVRIPIVLISDQDAFVVSGNCRLDAFTTDLSRDGSSAGVETVLYLPPKLPLRVEFKTVRETVGCAASVSNCRMEQGQRYLVGIELVFRSGGEKAKIVALLS